MALSKDEFKACQGLKDSYAFVSASEVQIALTLSKRKLVHIWTTGEGFHAWRLLPAGEQELELERARLRL